MDLTLALDLRLQCLADSLLLAARPEHGGAPFGGTVIALDPRNGEVLACSSVPSYDPNRFAIGLKGPEWAALQDETYPLLNRATQALYPPGSLFKVVTTLAGLDAGWLGPGTRMAASCGGGYRFGNRTFRCWRSGGHGGLDLRGAFAQSCDVYFYQLGRRLGIERLTDFAHALGLDAATGIDLPQEKTGLVPTREWYQRKLGTPPPEGNVLNLAIGQGELLVTPVAMAACVGALVTDGWVRQPRVALRANAADGTVAWEAGERGGLRQLPVTEGERDLLRDLLEEVVAHGTGSRAQVKGVRVGGKTGTAQNPHGSDHGLFLGVAPMEAPEIVIVAVIERAGHGGVVAAPIAQRLIEAWLVTLPAEELAAQQVEEEARAQAEAQAQAQWGAEGVQEGALPPGSPTKPSGAAQRSAADRDTIPTRGGGGEEEPPAGIHPSVEPGRDAPTPPAGSEPTVPPGAGSGGRREQGA
jgi:penicillin-binding protein 2